jgi:ABC-type spermidine/putrescine transport system permease subunit II
MSRILRGVGLRTLAIVLLAAVFAYLVLPIIIAASTSFAPQRYIAFPPVGFSLRWYVKFMTDPEWQVAIVNTIVIGVMCAIFATFLGTLTAYGINRVDRPLLRDALFVFFMTPVVVPYMTLAMALYPLYAQAGLIGSRLGVALAQGVVAAPYVVVAVTAAMRRRDRNLENAARTLGASPVRALWHIILPLMRPGIGGGAVLAFMTSFDDVVMPIFLGGLSANTIPKTMLVALYNVSDPSVMAVSATISAVGLLLLIAALFMTRRRQV